MPSKTEIGWRTGVVTDVRDLTTRTGAHYIKFFVQVTDTTGSFRASCLCPPSLVPGGLLYKWVRICNVPLAEIDASIRPELFRNKSVRVHVVQSREYYNITDCKMVGG